MVGTGRAGSGKIVLYFRSGEFKDEPKKFQEKLLAAFQGSIEEGTEDFKASFVKKVARKTGAFRKWFKKMITMQGDIGDEVVRVRLKFKPPPTDKYYKYHIPAFAPKTRFRVGKPYKDPTTPGTEPISISKALKLWSTAIEKRMMIKFAALGVSLKTSVKARWYRSG
ncbi:MAG: hypothetical protein HeimC3_40820 [Candidatus Heimdallarchaeota archaeon LC_3]|nr:MAG: hypothetical protein HeimC3_40820 [Candidatus Heimdallarchaeota archaeon LC_3]